MNFKLILAIITISIALIFYTTGVFSERKSGTLNKTHLVLFCLGLVFDVTGTTIMSMIAKSNDSSVQDGLALHQITGALAIALMLGHLLWAVVVYLKGSEKAKQKFHKFSIIVWLIWLIPYIAGIIIGMN